MVIHTFKLESIDIEEYKNLLLGAYNATEELMDFSGLHSDISIALRNFINELEREFWRLGLKTKMVRKEVGEIIRKEVGEKIR
ncbi:MAG: hypothetical protein K0M45_00375 [Candidatus Paracaedibacteraceae bacterium]|nr:hypothetical protein [Candidatus Paracaedibacteraceae bacterium]